MKNENEIRQEIIRLEVVLERLYELTKGDIYPETTNESIARYETNINALRWVINQ